MSDLVQTVEREGSVIAAYPRYDVHGMPSMPYTQYGVIIDGTHAFVNGPMSDDLRYVSYSIGDLIPLKISTYEAPSGNQYAIAELMLK